MKRKIFLVIFIVLVGIQFFRSPENRSATASANAIQNRYAVPENVLVILKKACNDCHSNTTEYPWYSHIQPVGWFLARHIKDGKHHLNFDEFLSYSYKRQDHKMEEVIEQLHEDEMPLGSYTLIHKEAKLNATEKQQLLDWAVSIRRMIAVDSAAKTTAAL